MPAGPECGACGETFRTVAEAFQHGRRSHCNVCDGPLLICSFPLNGNACGAELVSEEDFRQHFQLKHICNAAPSNEAMRACSKSNHFNVNSFTQNLSSVLTDPRRTKAETSVFFTRHWGDQFTPRPTIPPTPAIPKIHPDNFKHYLATTAKKHKHYLKSKRALRRALALHDQETGASVDDVPALFLTSDFTLKDPQTFEAVFLEPADGEIDKTASENELKKLFSGSISSSRPGLSRAPSTSSVVSSQSSQVQLPNIEGFEGRTYRPYQVLHNRLEYYHDVVGALLNNQLSERGEQFWKIVNSYGTLNDELASTFDKVKEVRTYLRAVKTKVYDRTEHILALQRARENRKRLLSRLEDITCLRDAQSTVQMLLNQNDFPRALECIETAQEVLSSELKGVVCFSQLNELHKAIGKMLLDEFVTLIQREFGRPIEKEIDASYQESQLHPVILGLLRCDEYKFLTVLRQEIIEAVKMNIRQIVKSRLVECEAMIPDYDPALSLGEQMRQMSFGQWLETLNVIFESLYFLCCRVLSIQDLILENIERVEGIQRYRNRLLAAHVTKTPSEATLKGESVNGAEDSSSRAAEIDRNDDEDTGLEMSRKPSMPNESGEIAGKMAAVSTASSVENGSNATVAGCTPANAVVAFLSMPCRNLEQLKTVVPYLIEHAILSSEERISKRLTTRYKDKFLERCSPSQFCEFEALIRAFLRRCRSLVPTSSTLSLDKTETEGLTPQRSPLIGTIQIQTAKFITSFQESSKLKLSQVLDVEKWRQADVPAHFQRIVDDFVASGFLRDANGNGLSSSESSTSATPISSPEPTEHAQQTLNVDGEQFAVVGAALLMLRILAQYGNVLSHFPNSAMELQMQVVNLLKQFNSRTCQLILGAGALQLVGLKTISVKTLALTVRCLQLIARFIPVVKQQFTMAQPVDKSNFGRHFDLTLRDYNDHIEEIYNKLVSVVDQHLLAGLEQWTLNSGVPSAGFQHIIRQVGKFYNGFSAIMPPRDTTHLLRRIHENFKVHLAEAMIQAQVTPHDSLRYGLASQDFNYYLENMRSLPDCLDFPDDSLASLPL